MTRATYCGPTRTVTKDFGSFGEPKTYIFLNFGMTGHVYDRKAPIGYKWFNPDGGSRSGFCAPNFKENDKRNSKRAKCRETGNG